MRHLSIIIVFILASVFMMRTEAKADELKRSDFAVENVSVSFSKDKKLIVLDLNQGSVDSMGFHTSIDLSRMDELTYRTRVMRYFGGILVSHDCPDRLRVITKEKVFEMAFVRKNVNDVVKLFGN